MKLDIFNGVTKMFHSANFQLKKHSPEILLVTGVVGMVASAVMACKATTKAHEIIEKRNKNLEDVKAVLASEEITEEQYSEEDAKKDMLIVQAKAGLEFVKLYAPSVILGALSITSVLAGHNILRQRNLGLAAAYAALDTGFKEYRGRLVDRFGEELDKELRYNIKAKEVETIEVNEDGSKEVVTKTVQVPDFGPKNHSIYARIYEDGDLGHSKDPELNLLYVRSQQNYANELLRSRGYLFLYEVYNMFGWPHTKASHVVGWTYDLKNPRGDNYVDFGLYDGADLGTNNFVNGFERNVVLDFNVDGPILDYFRD